MKVLIPFLGVGLFFLITTTASGRDLQEIRHDGVLRHLGIPYAHFVKPSPAGMTGLDVELMQLFATHLGVRYELVETSWREVFGDLTGDTLQSHTGGIKIIGKTPVKGDIIANGLTILPERQKIVNYSLPTFPTGVWLVARADSSIKPITPTGSIDKDIAQVKKLLTGRSVLSMKNTCLDPDLYGLAQTGAEIRYHTASQFLGDVAPAILDGVAEATLLDIPDALIALQKWPGEIKIIGPVSQPQYMGVAFAKDAPELRHAFDTFFRTIWADGTYKKLVEKYYPTIFLYLDGFFAKNLGEFKNADN
ncbi:transporter substrate-binding domain-containing protein [Desulfopila sp. IMCC35006]|nr:transporter substrate-binding domain-containing protein [Desulfopila sp. IMCC35006]